MGLSIAFVFVLRFLGAGITELSPQEAYYWNYAMHPALSYYDHPPMIAWVIRAGTFFFGDTVLGVRIGGLFLSVGSIWLVYLLGSLWFGRRAGLWSALLFQLIPLYFLYGVIITPDVPLTFFWLLTLYLLSISFSCDNKWGWYWAGVSLGMSMLSKYTGAFLIPSTLLFLLIDRSYRHWLWRKEPYIALIIAIAIFSPVIIWNYQHNWVSFGFQFTERLKANEVNPIIGFLEFIGIQAAVIFPTFFVGCVVVLVTSFLLVLRKAEPKWKFCLAYSLPMLAFFTYYSTQLMVKPNWTIPAYLSLLLATYPYYRYFRFKSALRMRIIGQKIILVSLYALPFFFILGVYHNSVVLPYIPVNKWVTGWHELGSIVKSRRMEFQAESGNFVFLIGMNKHYIASELAFYISDHRNTYAADILGERGLAYEYWDKVGVKGRNALAVHVEVPNVSLLKRYFASVDDNIEHIPITRGGNIVRTFYLVKCYGYLEGPASNVTRHGPLFG